MDQQTSSKKILSLHLEKCKGHCPNNKTCYHINKKLKDDSKYNIKRIRKELLKISDIIYESVCKPLSFSHIFNLSTNKNYNITISCLDLKKVLWPMKAYKDQIQVTVYTTEDIYKYKDWQKLFLVKDYDTYARFKMYCTKKDIGKIHFVLDQSWLNSLILTDIIKFFNDSASPGMSLDSCLTSWVLNGECPYTNNVYVDVTFDGSMRTCPFTKEEFFSAKKDLPESCFYKKYFRGELNEGKLSNTSIQNNCADNRIRAYTEHKRRFSLWTQGCDEGRDYSSSQTS